MQISESNEYCKKWASELNFCGKDLMKVTVLIQHQKNRLVTDANELKRLLVNGKSNNHSLYNACKFLLNSGNSEVLLKLFSDSHNDEDISEIIEVVDEFLRRENPQESHNSCLTKDNWALSVSELPIRSIPWRATEYF